IHHKGRRAGGALVTAGLAYLEACAAIRTGNHLRVVTRRRHPLSGARAAVLAGTRATVLARGWALHAAGLPMLRLHRCGLVALRRILRLRHGLLTGWRTLLELPGGRMRRRGRPRRRSSLTT